MRFIRILKVVKHNIPPYHLEIYHIKYSYEHMLNIKGILQDVFLRNHEASMT